MGNSKITGSAEGSIYGSGASSYPQSTTGNISGIFDMSGGVNEYVMGNYANVTSSSGFDSAWFNEISNQKYYDLYPSNVFTGTNTTNVTLCTIETCGGHALFETNSWYSDGGIFLSSGSSWFSRGGYNTYGSAAGLFFFNRDTGASDIYYGFRSVLVS